MILAEATNKKEIEAREKEFKKITDEFILKFNLEMFERNLYNKFYKTYKIEPISRTAYGFDANVMLQSGLDFKRLDESLQTIQQSLNCILILKATRNKSKAYLKVILAEVDESLPYRTPKIKPNEIHLGKTFSLEDLIIDCNKYCMFMVAGAVGSGKTRFLYSMLLSWITGCSPKEVSLFLTDLAKGEFSPFKKTKHVKGYAEDLDELLLIMEYLKKEMAYRKTILSEYRSRLDDGAANIEEYNSIQKYNKLDNCYFVVDEFSVVNPDASDTAEERLKKEKILAIIKEISKTGRSFGIFCILATQKTTKDEIPAILKNMSAVRISFRANDSISSQVILGDDSASGLEDRLGIYSLNGGADKDYLFTPYLGTRDMNALLKRYIDPKVKKESLDVLIKVLEDKTEKLKKFHEELEKADSEKGEVLIPKESKLSNVLKPKEKKVISNLPYEIITYDNLNVMSEAEYLKKSKKQSKELTFAKEEKKDKKPINGWHALEAKEPLSKKYIW